MISIRRASVLNRLLLQPYLMESDVTLFWISGDGICLIPISILTRKQQIVCFTWLLDQMEVNRFLTSSLLKTWHSRSWGAFIFWENCLVISINENLCYVLKILFTLTRLSIRKSVDRIDFKQLCLWQTKKYNPQR